MIPKDAVEAIDDALQLLPSKMDSARARVMLLAIGLQESRLVHRRQLVGNPPRPTGPAKGLWQFEQGGGCRGVVTHGAVKGLARELCATRGAAFTSAGIWNAIEHDDVMAAGCARLLLYTDAEALPELGDEAGAWELYARVWRPGKPHPATWPRHYADALDFVNLHGG